MNAKISETIKATKVGMQVLEILAARGRRSTSEEVNPE